MGRKGEEFAHEEEVELEEKDPPTDSPYVTGEEVQEDYND
jgi:hypothetical protein